MAASKQLFEVSNDDWGTMALAADAAQKAPSTPQSNDEKGWQEVRAPKKAKKVESKTASPAVQGAKKKLDFGNAPAAAGAGKNSATVNVSNPFDVLREEDSE